MQLPAAASEEPVSDPTKDDVLFGRDAQSWNHGGNQRFRSIVSKHQADYQNAQVRIKKVSIVAKIIAEVRSNGARFLKKQKGTDLWFEVPRKACVEKVGHAIRDKQVIAQRSLRGRQEQYLKKQAEQQKELIIQRKLCQLAAPPCLSHNEPTNIFVAGCDNNNLLSVKQQSLLQQRHEDNFLLAPKKRPTALSMLAAPRQQQQHPSLSRIGDRRLLINHHLQQQKQQQQQALHEGEAANKLAQYKREAEAAARKLVAAEDLYASIQKQKALEDELKNLRRQSSFLMTAMETPAPQPSYAPTTTTGFPSVGALPSGLLSRQAASAFSAAPSSSRTFLPCYL